jgi:DNA polymerase-1
MSTLYLIDGSSQMYRAYHAIRGLTGPDGRSTNAVFGFVMMLRRLVADHRPDLVAAAFDLAGPTFRSELASDYKAHRPPMPPDLEEQIPWVHRSCEALGVPVLVSEGFEADDVIGTLALKGAAAGFDVVIVTGDKDFYQLVGGRIRVFNPRDEGTWYDEAGVVEKFGVPPRQVIDVLALTGDAVDNVKGVPGIGEKGARELLAQFGSLDALLEQVASVTQKRYREALLANAASARLSRELVTIRADVPVDADLERFRYPGPAREACYALFSELGFKTLTREFAPADEAASVVRDYEVVDSIEALEMLVGQLRAAGRFGLRVVGDGPAAMHARLVGIALSGRDGHARYIPLGHRSLDEDPNLPERAALNALRPLLEDPALQVAGHDLKTDMIVLARHGVRLGGRAFDTMLASYLLDSTRAPHALETIALEHLGVRAATEELTYGKGIRAIQAADLPAAASLAFAGERAELPLRLVGTLQDQLARHSLAELNDTMELPLVSILARIEQLGVRVDTAALAELSKRLERDLQALGLRIFEMGGGEFNINSPKQLAEVLFERLQLPASKKTGKTRVASTAVGVLEELALTHELPRFILEWRSMQKLKGTYIDALPLLVHADTGRVHTSFNQAVAATGRLSSSDPNLQNIPVRTELGREIRRAFIADPGCVLISADYSQIELRVLAHLAGDEALIEAFKRGEDIHDRTADAIFGPDSTKDRKERRNVAKMINYALLYGKTAFTLAKDIGVTQQAAQAFIDAYFAGFPGVRRFLDRTLEEARVSGVVKTLFGRRRPVPELTSQNGQVRSAAERIAVNMPIQGTAADIMKRAMIDVDRALAGRRAAPDGRHPRMILTVHDELVFEVRREESSEIAALVRNLMEAAATLAVPLTVDVSIGDNWKDAKP